MDDSRCEQRGRCMLLSLMSYLVISHMYCVYSMHVCSDEYICNDIVVDGMACDARMPGRRGS